MYSAHNLKQHEQQLKRRHKVCAYCGVQYCDITKRFVGKTCTQECASALMVSKRLKDNTYQRTDEQNRKMVDTITKMRSEGKCQLTDAGRKNIIDNVKKSHNSGKIKAGFCKKYGTDHWTKTKAGREKVSILNKGKVISLEQRKQLSIAAIKRLQTENQYSRCKRGKRVDLGNIFFRSAWEANYARVLNYKNIKWEYEPTTFDLSDALTYTPDFKLEDGTFVEVKGWWQEKSKQKVDLFKQKIPKYCTKFDHTCRV
jgi:hypothetical protein